MRLAVASLILVFATVLAAGFAFSQFTFNLTEKLKTTFPAQTLQVEFFGINKTCITVQIRNFASVDVQVTEVYVDGERCDLQEPVVVSPNEIGIVFLRGHYVNGRAYNVRMFSGLSFPLVFDVKYK